MKTKKKSRKGAKRGKKALNFLRGELLRDAYDGRDRVRRLLWADSGQESEDKYGYKRQFWDDYDDEGAGRRDGMTPPMTPHAMTGLWGAGEHAG